jgi:hypothetical protein
MAFIFDELSCMKIFSMLMVVLLTVSPHLVRKREHKISLSNGFFPTWGH